MWKLDLVRAFASVAVVLLGLGAGLSARPDDLAWLWRRPGLLVRSLVAAELVMPIVVLVVIFILPLPRETRASLVTLAIVPAAPLAAGKSTRQGGHPAYGISLEVTLIALMVVTIPLFQIGLGLLVHRDVSVGALVATKRAVLTQVVPLGLGLLAAWRWPARASQLGALAAKLAMVMLLVLLAMILVLSARALVHLGAASYVGMALAATATVVAGHTLGGPAQDTRRTLAVFSVLRHPGLALLLVSLNAPGVKVVPAILAYLIVASVVLAVYHRFAGASSGQPHGPVVHQLQR